MKFINLLLIAFVCLLKNIVKATKFGPMAESLALGDVEYRMEEIHSVNQKDYMGKIKVSKNLKNSTIAKTHNKINKRLSTPNNNDNFSLGIGSNLYQIALFTVSVIMLF